MAKNDKRPNVLLTTLPNGYALTVDEKEYMAFDVENMMAQVFTHIALNETEYLSANFVNSLFEGAGRWPRHKDAYTALADQIAIVKDQQKTINRLYKRLSDMGKDKDDVEKTVCLMLAATRLPWAYVRNDPGSSRIVPNMVCEAPAATAILIGLASKQTGGAAWPMSP
jgi:hypothetical protein